MKPDVFFSALENIREDLVADALKTEYVRSAPMSTEHNSQPKAARQPVRTILVIAASLLLVVMIGSVLYLKWNGGVSESGDALAGMASSEGEQTEPEETAQTDSGVSDRNKYGLELVEYVDYRVIELGGVRYQFYMPASPLFDSEYYEITVPSDFHVGEVVGYETDNTYDWYYAEVKPLSGWLIRYMRRNGEDKYSEGELYKTESITEIPQWIEDARKAIMENTGGYPGLEEGYTIIPDSDPPFQGSFGLTWEYVEEQTLTDIPIPAGGYTETWTEEQIYEYIPENLLYMLDEYFGKSRQRTTHGDHKVVLYPDGTVSSGVSMSYVLPNTGDSSPYELLAVVNKDRIDEEMQSRYPIGEPNNEIAGVPVWLGWTNAEPSTDDGFVSTDYTLMAAFEYDGTYYFLRQTTAADGLFLGTIQTILETYWTVRDNSALE